MLSHAISVLCFIESDYLKSNGYQQNLAGSVDIFANRPNFCLSHTKPVNICCLIIIVVAFVAHQ